MTDKEIIIDKIKQLKDLFKTEREKTTTTGKGMVDKLSFSSKIVVLEELLAFINLLPAEKPSEDLEEAANKYADDNPSLCLENDGGIYEDFAAPRRNFIAGAQWQKEQMMKSAIDAKIVNDETSGCVVDCEQGCLVLEPHRYLIGQKLKILIVKEEQ